MEVARARVITLGEVTLTPLEQADLQELAAAMEEQELKRRLNYYHGQSMISHLRRQIDQDRLRGELTWAIHQSGSPRGICGIWPFDPLKSLGIKDWSPGIEGVLYLNEDSRGTGLAQIITSLSSEKRRDEGRR